MTSLPPGQDPYESPVPAAQDPFLPVPRQPQPQDSPPPGYPQPPDYLQPSDYPLAQAYPQPPAYPQPYSSPPAGYGPGYQAGYQPAYPGGPVSYGYDPLTGQAYSDKSKLAAGLLQLLPGFFLSVGGIGRLYAGHTALGAAQLVVSLLVLVSVACLWWVVVPLILVVGTWLWAVIDGIVLLAGRPVDGQGRLLRP